MKITNKYVNLIYKCKMAISAKHFAPTSKLSSKEFKKHIPEELPVNKNGCLYVYVCNERRTY